MEVVWISPQKLAKSKKYKIFNKIYKNENLEEKKPTSRICTKEHTCQIWWWSEHIKTEKIEDDELDRHSHTGIQTFYHWLILGPTQGSDRLLKMKFQDIQGHSRTFFTKIPGHCIAN